MFNRSNDFKVHIKKFTCDYMERVVELTYVVTKRWTSVEEISDLYKTVYQLYLEDRFTDVLKYEINVLFNTVYDLEQPKKIPSPGPFSIFPRTLMSWYSLKKGDGHRNRTKVQEGLLTIFQGFKKGILPLSPLKIVEAVQKHEKCLTKPTELSEDLRKEVLGKTRKILSHWTAPALRECNSESKAAAFEVNRSNGGSIYGAMKILHSGSLEAELSLISPEFIGYASTWKEGEGPSYRAIYARFPDTRTILSETFWYKPKNQVRPAFILEPLKVRTVTLSSTLGQRYFSPIQKGLWEYLQKMQWFQLIGRPLENNDVQKLVSKMSSEDYMLSGDWSAATDNLKNLVSSTILDVIIEKVERSNLHDLELFLDFQERARCGFLESDIVYSEKMFPKYKGVTWNFEEKTVRQANGQLMGNKLSFVILCIANMCVHWISCEKEAGKLIPLNSVPECLINGDDYLSVCTEKRYQIWDEVATAFGLEKSLGKNFFSKKVAQINSETYFLYEHSSENLLMMNGHGPLYSSKLVRYCNFGLLLGRGKGMDMESNPYDGSRYKKILEKGTVKQTESSSDDFESNESPLRKVFEKLFDRFESVELQELWDLQMDLLGQHLLEQLNHDVRHLLPGRKFCGIDFLEFITGSVNEQNRQTNFPEFSLGENFFSLRKRRDRSMEYAMCYYFIEDDECFRPANQWSFLWRKYETQKDILSREEKLHY